MSRRSSARSSAGVGAPRGLPGGGAVLAPSSEDIPAREEREADDPARVPQHVEAEALPAQGQPGALQLVAVDAARGAEAQRALERRDEAGQAGGGGDVARRRASRRRPRPRAASRRASGGHAPQAVRGRDELAARDRFAERAQELALEAELADEEPASSSTSGAASRPSSTGSGLEPLEEARRRRHAEAVPVGRLAGPRDLALPLRAALDAQEDPLPVAGEELAEGEDAPLARTTRTTPRRPSVGPRRRGSASRSSSPRP